MTSQPVNQINAIHILPNISRSKDNQTMEFGLLIKHEKHYLSKNHTQNVVEKLFPDLFLKHQN